MTSHFDNPIFHDDYKAREWLEARVWPKGPVCPHCGSVDGLTRLAGKAHRIGTFQCNACRDQFTVTVGTVFERTKIALSKWLMALYLLNSSKKGVSSHQIHRTLGVSYKTAWFMTHRIREAMKDGGLLPQMGGPGSVVEIDETFIGQKKDVPKRRGYAHKHAVMTLVERGKGSRSFHVGGLPLPICFRSSRRTSIAAPM
jgi:transposase-like protein